MLLTHTPIMPADLTTLFYNYTGKQKARDTAFKEFIIPFMQELNSVIWTERASNFKQWETTQGITKKKKKRYHQFFKHDRKETSRINIANQTNLQSRRNHPLSIPYDRSDGRLA
uniref:Uncharacterized protein n=2 Tax=Rhizophagus irregularis TaxID=588596 RepID=U9U325_RHIID